MEKNLPIKKYWLNLVLIWTSGAIFGIGLTAYIFIKYSNILQVKKYHHQTYSLGGLDRV